jgi:hypothetical protein
MKAEFHGRALVMSACVLVSTAPAAIAQTAGCEKLADLKLPATTIATAQFVVAGAFVQNSGPAAVFKALPAFAGSPASSSRPAIQISGSRSGCPLRTGTASSRGYPTLALERWAEQGVAPSQVIAAKRQDANAPPSRTRPLCAYPQVARYNGSGSVDEAANFSCVPPAAGSNTTK